MSFDTISLKRCNQIEQQIAHILKTMRSTALRHHPIYEALEKFEQELANARRKQYDENHIESPNY